MPLGIEKETNRERALEEGRGSLRVKTEVDKSNKK